MTSKRLKQLIPFIPSDDEQLAALIHRTEQAQLTMEEAIAKRDKRRAEALASIEAKYAYDVLIDEAGKSAAESAEILEAWSLQNSKRFGDKKSLVLFGLHFGYRSNGWKTATVGKTNWTQVVERLEAIVNSSAAQGMRDIAKGFLRIKTEPNKEAMLAAREDTTLTGFVFCQGVAFEEDEKFFAKFTREGQGGTELV